MSKSYTEAPVSIASADGFALEAGVVRPDTLA